MEDDVLDSKLSLQEIIQLGMETFDESFFLSNDSQRSLLNIENGRASKGRQLTLWVQNQNPYSGEKDSVKTVSVRILEVLFDDQPCNLLYMQDLT